MAMNVIPFHTRPVRMIDGPLVDLHRSVIIRQMADVIIQTGTASDHDDAWLALRVAGFKVADIVMGIDDARQVAAQDLVSQIMGAPVEQLSDGQRPEGER